MCTDFTSQLLFPDLRVMNVRGLVNGEILARFLVRCVMLAQAARFFCGDARNLRFVSVEGGQSLRWRTLAGNAVEVVGQRLNLGQGLMDPEIATRAHPLREIEPKVGVRSRGISVHIFSAF